MMHLDSEATYQARLENILEYLQDFHAKKYSRDITFYDETSDKIDDQIKSVSKDVQYRLSRLQHSRKQLVEEVEYLEQSNIGLAKDLQSINKEKVQYQEKAKTIQDQHQRINFNKGSIELIRKNVRSYQMLVDLLNQLAVLDHHHKHLKADGYIRKLIQKLYKKPEQLDLLENTTDLVQVIEGIKDEIIQVESIIAPAQKMVFKDSQEMVDEDLIEKYAAMEE
jgi:predicted nuclease with TOPRIM domain